ncbi:MAG: alpha/beta hydrolase [Beijerinckiaceae bacterium]|nr:alpha/beta hydrolase [Beijerinckiaceae bacterium]MCI0735920.1 alpha/beta hydrolase [Beijerinckiaceae bacterium]
MNPGLEHVTFRLAEVSIHAVAAGPRDGPLVILLHGFPEFWYGWRGQISPLAEAGFRVVVPDQRGYNESSKPEDWRAYELPHLVADVFGIADSLGCGKFLLAGHDWGGIIAWACAMGHPERIRRLAILNSPHPTAFMKYIRTHPAQILRSSYMFFMQLPWLPEALFQAANFRMMTGTFTNTSRPGTFTERNFEAYRNAWRQPGAPRGMLNWYRALRVNRAPLGNPTIEIPVKILWGLRERFLASELPQLSLNYCRNGQLTLFPEAGHWLQHEEPVKVSDALKEFFVLN